RNAQLVSGEIKIFDLLGKELTVRQVNRSYYNVAHLKNGVYTLVLRDTFNKKSSHKFVVNR
ncbi:MAG: T9SS type A sorting domain-containing protein, partial [Flavobacteriales bacterium]|nr:T9SS type A sorting domain-containing protein [Flavobacteriales bacterium]